MQLFIDKEKLLSQEGTTQGGPLAMALYAIRLQPLVKCLNKQEVKQVWFADDSAAGGKLCGLLQWWQPLVAEGPKLGYHQNSDKTWVVVKYGLLCRSCGQILRHWHPDKQRRKGVPRISY